MRILGLNAYHGDSAACIFVDGKLVAAAEEERFRRIKHWAGLPTQAIDYCLREAGLTINEIDHIAVNRKPGVNNLRRLWFVLRHRPDPRLMWQKVRNIRKAATVKEALESHYRRTLRAESHHIEHHHAHLASAFLVSGFEEAACLSVDGFGDFASTAFGLGGKNGIAIEDRVYFPHSLGIFYSAVTQFIGFPHYGDEYKVMGLAPYGEPKFVRQMSGLVEIANNGKFKLDLRYFRHHTANVSYSWNNCAPEFGKLYREEMAELLGSPRDPDAPLEQRHKDLARSAQIVYEEAFFALLLALHRRYPVPNLALSGGCAMNSVANGKVYLRTPFRKMYLPAAAGDAGGAIGAACVVQTQLANGMEQGAGSREEEAGSMGHGARSRGDQGAEGSLPSRSLGEGWKSEVKSQRSEGDASRSKLHAPSSELTNRRSPITNHSPELRLDDPYLGPHFSNDEIEVLLSARGLLSFGDCSHGSVSRAQ